MNVYIVYLSKLNSAIENKSSMTLNEIGKTKMKTTKYEINAFFKHSDYMRWSTRENDWKRSAGYDGSDSIDNLDDAIREFKIALSGMLESDPPGLKTVELIEYIYDSETDETDTEYPKIYNRSENKITTTELIPMENGEIYRSVTGTYLHTDIDKVL